MMEVWGVNAAPQPQGNAQSSPKGAGWEMGCMGKQLRSGAAAGGAERQQPGFVRHTAAGCRWQRGTRRLEPFLTPRSRAGRPAASPRLPAPPPNPDSLRQGALGVREVDGGGGAQQLLQVARNQLLLQPLQLPGQSHGRQLLLGRRLLHGALWIGGGVRSCPGSVRPPLVLCATPGPGAVSWISPGSAARRRSAPAPRAAAAGIAAGGSPWHPTPLPAAGRERKMGGGHRAAQGAQKGSGSAEGMEGSLRGDAEGSQEVTEGSLRPPAL